MEECCGTCKHLKFDNGWMEFYCEKVGLNEDDIDKDSEACEEWEEE